MLTMRMMSSARMAEPIPINVRQDEVGDQRDEGRHHEHVAMGEVHHADDAEHHGVADGDETVDGTERDAVDELLNEDFHPPAVPLRPATKSCVDVLTGSPRIRQRRVGCQCPRVSAKLWRRHTVQPVDCASDPRFRVFTIARVADHFRRRIRNTRPERPEAGGNNAASQSPRTSSPARSGPLPGRNISTASRRPRSLHLWRAGQGRHDTSGVPQFRPHHRQAL